MRVRSAGFAGIGSELVLIRNSVRRRLTVGAVVAAAAALPVLGWAAGGGTPGANRTLTADEQVAAVYAGTAPSTQPTPSPAQAAALRRAALSDHGRKARWLVGFAKESIDPRPCTAGVAPDKCDLNGNFHLGGFGLAPTRTSTGPTVDGNGAVEHLYARAMAISNTKGQTLLLAGLENQGTFAAYKQGPFGLYDIRAQVAHDTGVPLQSIVINADHSHAGPDLIGLWGGVPVSYLQLVHDRTVKALDEAFKHRVPATLQVGTNDPAVPVPAVGGYLPGTARPGEFLDHSQFNVNTGPVTAAQDNGVPLTAPPSPVPDGATGYRDDVVDTQLRVLQAYDRQGNPLGTLINYAAHADVMGGDNVRYSGDWPARVAQATEVALHEPVAVAMVADVGRTQPPRPHSDAKCNQPGHPTCDVDQLDTWTRLMTPWVVDAVAHAVPVRGSTVGSREVMTREVATNPALLGVGYTGEVPVRGYGAYRSTTPPWIAGVLLGTFVASHRIGDILLTTNPGEAYPDIRFGVLKQLTGVQAAFTFGLANDQLGYLIAPASEYPWISYSNVGNDNSFFNVSAQYGDHVYCTQTAESLALGFQPTGEQSPYGANAVQPVCPVLTALDGVPTGPTPQQPWAAGDGVALPPPFPQ